MPRRLWVVLLTLAVLALLAGAWQWLAFQDHINAEAVRGGLERMATLGDRSWLPVVLVFIYVAASLLVFPLSLLVAATGLIYGELWGFLYAMLGTLVAALVTYLIGWGLGRETLQRHGGERLNRLARLLAERGIRTMVFVSVVPIAPFTLTNMAAGAFHIRLRDYLAGSLIGLTPGLFAMTVIGARLPQLLLADNLDVALGALAAIVLALGVLVALRRLLARRQPPPGTAAGSRSARQRDGCGRAR